MTKQYFFLIISFFFISSISLTQTVDSKFHSEIQNIYSFHPRLLSATQQEAKSKAMDKFWNKVESNKNYYLPLLRTELSDFKNPSFFLYDGSQLLLSLSNQQNDKVLCLKAIAHCDLNDVEGSNYVYTVNKLAAEGLNTTEAALHILDYPEFKAFFPMHALTLEQNYSLLCMLLPTDESYYIYPCIAQLKVQKDNTGIQTLIMLLWYTVTTEGDKALANILTDSRLSQKSKDYLRELQSEKDKVLKNSSALFNNSNYSDLKKERRKSINHISDEALYDLEELTMKIRLAFNKIK